MEITKKMKFKTDFYGSKAYLPGDELVQGWLESQQDRLLHPRFRALKDAVGNEKKLEEILSVFNVNGNGEPIIGSWMLHQCSINAAKLANTWGKFQVSKDRWKDSVQFTPAIVSISSNGGVLKKAESVEVYTVTVKGGRGGSRSFFKAYQIIKAGAEFEFTIDVPEDLCEKQEGKGQDKIFYSDKEGSITCANTILDKMGSVGVGAYRLRFGKFEGIEGNKRKSLE